MTRFGFELLAGDGAARRGRLTTAFGTVETPAFMRSARPPRSRP
jgi:queuine tRNA-ribosyltransferase